MAEGSTVSLGLGGNIGDPAASMAYALIRMDTRADIRVTAVSRLYRTPPWGYADQAWFLNCCALLETALDPKALLAVCKRLEEERRRVQTVRYGPRTLDIDILTYGREVRPTGAPILPHPRMTERGFVMIPLAEIAPDLVISGRSARAWADAADGEGMELASDNGAWWRGDF